MIKSMLKLLGLSAAGLAAYLVVTKRDPKEFANSVYSSTRDKINGVSNVLDQKNKLTANISKLQDEVSKSKPTIEAMQRDIDEYQFKINPHVDLINQRINNITK